MKEQKKAVGQRRPAADGQGPRVPHARELHPADGVQCVSRAWTKSGAAASPARSSRRRSCSIPDRYVPRICDSKTVTALERERLYEQITRDRRLPGRWRRPIATEIDRINIHQASLRAMQRAVLALVPFPDFVLVDAFRIPDLPMAQRAVMHGDTRCTAIAAASIVAKVTRDRMMLELHAQDPRYGFDRHKGYATTRPPRRGRRASATPTCTGGRSGRHRCLIGWPDRC